MKEIRNNRPFRRIGVYAAWEFKNQRFVKVAQKLGIINSFYFHSFISGSVAALAELAQSGEAQYLARFSDNPLLLDATADKKRRRRYQPGALGTYDERLDPLKKLFPEVFDCQDAMKANIADETVLQRFQQQFDRHIVRGQE